MPTFATFSATLLTPFHPAMGGRYMRYVPMLTGSNSCRRVAIAD